MKVSLKEMVILIIIISLVVVLSFILIRQQLIIEMQCAMFCAHLHDKLLSIAHEFDIEVNPDENFISECVRDCEERFTYLKVVR